MTFKLDKKAKSLIAVYAIILVVYVLLFALIPFRKIAASWIAFAFSVISVIVSLAVCVWAFKDSDKPVSKVYGFPIFRVGFVYAAIQLAVSVIIFIIAAFVRVPYWVSLLLGVILLAACAIGVIATDNTRDVIEELEEKTADVTKKVSLFKIDVAGISDCCDDPETKKELEKLVEAFRYSDPVSSPETEEIESVLSDKIASLRALLTEDKKDEIKAMIRDISNTLTERNRICKANKR